MYISTIILKYCKMAMLVSLLAIAGPQESCFQDLLGGVQSDNSHCECKAGLRILPTMKHKVSCQSGDNVNYSRESPISDFSDLQMVFLNLNDRFPVVPSTNLCLTLHGISFLELGLETSGFYSPQIYICLLDPGGLWTSAWILSLCTVGGA